MAHIPPELLLLRHAKSARDTDAARDFDRPLAPRGRRDARRMGDWLREQALTPDLVVSSPARRARQTARRALRALSLDPEAIRWDERIYEATPETLLEVLAEAPADCERLLLVGHNPGLEELVEQLCGAPIETPPGAKPFPSGALAWFRQGALVRLVRPRSLENRATPTASTRSETP